VELPPDEQPCLEGAHDGQELTSFLGKPTGYPPPGSQWCLFATGHCLPDDARVAGLQLRASARGRVAAARFLLRALGRQLPGKHAGFQLDMACQHKFGMSME
jgi:hypothetical protein